MIFYVLFTIAMWVIVGLIVVLDKKTDPSALSASLPPGRDREES